MVWISIFAAGVWGLSPFFPISYRRRPHAVAPLALPAHSANGLNNGTPLLLAPCRRFCPNGAQWRFR